jgi:hypothetical protein
MMLLALYITADHIAKDVVPPEAIGSGGLIYDDGRWHLMYDGEWKPIEGVII